MYCLVKVYSRHIKIDEDKKVKQSELNREPYKKLDKVREREQKEVI